MIAEPLERTRQRMLRNLQVSSQEPNCNFFAFGDPGLTIAELAQPGRFDNLAKIPFQNHRDMVGSWIFIQAKDGPAIFHVTECDEDGHLWVTAFNPYTPARVGRPPKAQAA